MTEPNGLEPPTPRQNLFALLVGSFVIIYAASCLIAESYGWAFFAIPSFVGFIAGVLSPRGSFRAALYALLASLALSVLVRVEGVVCILFSLPILFPLLWLGTFVGSVLRRYTSSRQQRNQSALLALLLGLGAQVWSRYTDHPSQHPVQSAESHIAIAAPPAAVFAALTQRELRVQGRWQWFIRVGLPIPERMLVEKAGVGGSIRFDFNQGTAFARISEWEPGRSLTYRVDRYDIHDLPFHITRLGRGPDYGFRRERVEDWLTLESTRFTLEAATDGGTLLTRRCVWRRHLAPAFYFGWLQQNVMEGGQRRLLELIKERVASQAAEAAIAAR